MRKRKISGFLMVVSLALVLVGLSITSTMAQIPPHLDVNKSVSPTQIWQKNSGMMPNETTVTLTLTGAGNPIGGTVPVDVVFGIDSSGSMGWNDPTNLRLTASKNFVDQMNSTTDQAGVVSWDSNIDFTQPLTNNFSLVKEKIDQVGSSGGTNLDVGLNESIDVLDAGGRPGSAHVIIFLTNGVGSYTPSGQPGSQADRAASKGYVIYTIGLGSAPAEDDLREIANVTGGKYYHATNASVLVPIYNEIAGELLNLAGINIVVTDVLHDYINEEDAFTVLPNNITTNPDGTTTIVWNVGTLAINDTWNVSFNASSDKCENDLLVDVYGDSNVTYTDYQGNITSAVFPETYIDVICNQPPNVTDVYPSIYCLWPPNHKFVDITIEGVTDPDNDSVTINITGITSDEPTASIKGAGDATHAPDADGVGTDTASVRAERSGKGNGRVYEITFVASDGKGGETEGSVTVCVPHDRRKGTCDCIDDGQIYDATEIN